MVVTILTFAILVVNHTIFSSLGLYFIRGYGELIDARKFFLGTKKENLDSGSINIRQISYILL